MGTGTNSSDVGVKSHSLMSWWNKIAGIQYSLSLSLSHSQSMARVTSYPGSSTGVLGRFGSEGWATTSTASGRALGSIAADVMPFHQHHCKVFFLPVMPSRGMGHCSSTLQVTPQASRVGHLQTRKMPGQSFQGWILEGRGALPSRQCCQLYGCLS